MVKDNEGQLVSATLSIIVNREKTSLEIIEERRDRIDHGVFNFRRVAPGPVIGAADFGITWKTVEPVCRHIGFHPLRLVDRHGALRRQGQ